MKKHYINVLTGIVLVALQCIGCSKKDDRSPAEGHLKLITGISVEIYDVYSNLKAATSDNFVVTIFDEWGTAVISYPRAAEMPEIIDLPAGNYYAVAHSNNNQPAVFDIPYYSGESEMFTITAGETSTVNITAVLSNIMVTVVYSQSVRDEFTDYRTRIWNTEGSLTYVKTETRAGYFDAGPLNVEATLIFLSGSGEQDSMILTGQISEPEFGKHYEIHVEAAQVNGSGALSIDIDETYETEILTIHPPVGYGDLLITEIMFNPDSLEDTQGEWFEIYNNSPYTQNLRYLVIRRGSNNTFHVISSDMMVNSGDYAVMGRTENATDHVDYSYGTISLSNTSENLIINTYGTNGTDGIVICSVDYGAAGFSLSGSTGKSIQLNRGIQNADAAMLGTNWCLSTLTYNTGDYGTPGEQNSICE